MPPPKTNRPSVRTKATRPRTKRSAGNKTVTPPKRKQEKVKPEDLPLWDQNVTSKAARERARFRLSRTSFNDEVDEEQISKLVSGLTGENIKSWGVTRVGPIKAPRRRKKNTFRLLGLAKREEEYLEMLEDMLPAPREIIPNSPDRSPLLRIPFELREKIYGYLLVYPTSIMIRDDWPTVEKNPFRTHSLILVCKQIALEASNFLYTRNSFRVVLRERLAAPRHREEPFYIDTKYHASFRNMIIDCSKECWNINWYEKVAYGIKKLADAKPVIHSLTLITVPSRALMSTTALGVEFSPIRFADFLWYPGPLMTGIRDLAPRNLKVILKTAKTRLLIAVDMRHLLSGNQEIFVPANEETLRIGRERAKVVDDELLELKERFEEVHLDPTQALLEGRCKLLKVENKIADYPSLQPRATTEVLAIEDSDQDDYNSDPEDGDYEL